MILLTRFHEHCAARCLAQGGIIAQATEGVWGLACDAGDDQAIEALIELKRRSAHQGLIVALSSVEDAVPLLKGLTASRRREVTQSWPGHVTWLVPMTDNSEISDLVRGNSDRIALRVPAHAQMQRVINLAGVPIISTSANPSGYRSAQSALRVRQYFGNALDMVLPGSLGDAKGPSEIRDAVSGSVLRAASRNSS